LFRDASKSPAQLQPPLPSRGERVVLIRPNFYESSKTKRDADDARDAHALTSSRVETGNVKPRPTSRTRR
jgi:hypothetical protein